MPNPGATSPVDATGLFGSLRYSSKPDAEGGLNESVPLESKYSDRAAAFLGGQASNRCHSLRPVSNRYAFGTAPSAEAFSPLPLPFKFCTKNGSSMFSRKKSPVLESKLRLPSVSPASARPPAVPPRPHHQRVGRARAVLFHRIEKLQRARQVLGIEPASHPHHRRLDVLHVRRQRARLPELVIAGVLDVFVPVHIFVLQVLLIGIGNGTHAQKEVIGVEGAGIERHASAADARDRVSRGMKSA